MTKGVHASGRLTPDDTADSSSAALSSIDHGFNWDRRRARSWRKRYRAVRTPFLLAGLGGHDFRDEASMAIDICPEGGQNVSAIDSVGFDHPLSRRKEQWRIMRRAVVQLATSVLLCGAPGLAGFALANTAQADPGSQTHRWCPGEPLPQTGYPSHPVVWPMHVCHDWYTIYDDRNDTMAVIQGEPPLV